MRVWNDVRNLKTLDLPEINHIPLPSALQTTESSCGVASLRSILKYWGTYNSSYTEKILMEQLKTTYSGTTPKSIAKIARKHGLCAKIERRMSITNLTKYVLSGVPVICPIQAWGNDIQYDKMQSGHYVVVISVDEHVLFQDPLVMGFRGSLPVKEFRKRWKDWESAKNGWKLAIRLGIPIYGEWEPVETLNRTESKVIQ